MAKSSISEQPASPLDEISARIRACRLCRDVREIPSLPREPRPVFRASATAPLLVASQAPGMRVHQTGLPFNDPSGDRLRQWMGVDRDTFYDEAKIAIVPMGFCFPGYNALKADLPPRRECRATWHDELFARLPQIETILAIGRYAQDYHFARLGRSLPKAAGVDEIVRRWREFKGTSPRVFALPHPFWRNSGWLKRNMWFETEVLPAIRAEVARLTSN
ncbi:MAG: uracil-DNA glycosylase family protein [Methylobacteriaceae bacterium]|nr:uracil-DNA glycosylase family protein [Methylobacteriaceae bacterium]